MVNQTMFAWDRFFLDCVFEIGQNTSQLSDDAVVGFFYHVVYYLLFHACVPPF